MLDDVAALLHLPIVDALHDFQPLRTDEAVLLLVELFMVSPEVAMAKTGQCDGPYVCLQWLRDIYQCRCQTRHWTAAARAYLLHLLSCTLFANKSTTYVHVVHLQALCDLTLARRLNTNRQLVGYITLLQCWIYKHFLSVVECNADPDYDEVSPRACRWIATKKTMKKVSTAMYRQCLDRLQIPHVRWGPIVVKYRLKRVMRQFGYIQCIPAHPVHPWVSYDDVDDTWTHYSDHLATADDPCVVPGPKVRYPSGPESDIPQVSDDPVRSDVDEPRHAVEACDAIAERLERHLSLGVVTSGTSTYEVIKECLKIARSVTQDHIVYVRSRHRHRMDQP
ncbi:hypothetical protein GmHk_05G013115 [Glycine max]|nr:hypothetical protein GmHk_05G013115 [Glycine max]